LGQDNNAIVIQMHSVWLITELISGIYVFVKRNILTELVRFRMRVGLTVRDRLRVKVQVGVMW